MAIPVIYESKASRYLLNSYFTDETDILQIGYGGSYGTVNNIGTHDTIYFGLSFYAPEHVESYSMIIPYTEVSIYNPETNKWVYRYDWDISQYHKAIRSELDSHTEADIYFYVKAVKDDVAYIAWQKGHISIVNNTAPTINDISIICESPVNSDYAKNIIYNLVGNYHTVISGITNAMVDFSITPNKGSYLVGYQIKNGSKSTYYPYISRNEVIYITRSLTKCETGTFEIMAEDSRGFRSYKTKTISYVDYFNPTIHITNSIVINPTNGNAVINVEGQAFNKSFGAKNNSLYTYIVYREVGSSSWSSYHSFTSTFNGNNFSGTRTITGLDYRKHYEFQAFVEDSLVLFNGGAGSELVYGQGLPVFDWNGESFRFNVPVNLENGANINGITSIDGNTTIIGDLNVTGNVFASGNSSGGGSDTGSGDTGGGVTNVGYENGHWLPQVNCIASPTHAWGKWVRVGSMCIINFYIEGTTTSTVDKVEITNFPFEPESSTSYFRWQSGGGFCNNYAVVDTTSSSSSSDVNRSTHRFTGWSIEGGKLYGRTQSAQKGTAATTSGTGGYTKAWRIIDDGYYIGAVSGKLFRASGTLMYLITGMED